MSRTRKPFRALSGWLTEKLGRWTALTTLGCVTMNSLSDEAVCPVKTFEPLPRAEALFRNSGATIIEKGQNAFFAPSTDEIRLPERCLFTDAANFYATGLHELIHWSGAKSRLNREMKGKFGSEGGGV